jgi:hypothetical protein
MPTVSARSRKDRAPLTEEGILSVLRAALPKRNGYMVPNTAELLDEAQRFGINSRRKLRHLLLRHRRQLIADDRAALCEAPYINHIREDHGAAYVAEMQRKQRCFTWEGLVRNAFELEFGEAYETFANRRDAL